MGYQALLQGIFPIQGSNPGVLHWQADFFFFLPPGHLGNPLLFVVRIKGDHLGDALETGCGTKSVNVSYSYLLSDFCLTHTLGDRASEAIMQRQISEGQLQGKPSF